MNWEAITAIAQTAGVIGVIISIVYLSIQIRHSNQASWDATFKSTLALSISSHHEMIEGDNGETIIRGLLNYENLQGREKLIFDSVISSWFTVVASALFSKGLGFFDDEHTETLRNILHSRFFPYSGIHSWWQESKGIFSTEAQLWFEKEMAEADMSQDFFRIKEAGGPSSN